MLNLTSSLIKNIGIDFGSSRVRVFVEGRNIVVSEPAIVAAQDEEKNMLAVGDEAVKALTRRPERMMSRRALQNGVVADYQAARFMLRYFINKSLNRSVKRFRVLMGVPAGSTSVEKRALLDALMQSGAQEAYLIESGAAAAIGAGLPIFQPKGHMVVDLGGGMTEATVVSLGGIVVSAATQIGGFTLNQRMMEYIRERYDLLVGYRMIEDIKIEIGTAIQPIEDKTVTVTGRDLTQGVQLCADIRSSELYEIFQEPIGKIVELIQTVLSSTPPELCADIMENGIILTGGASRLQGLPAYLSQVLGVPVHLAQDPENAGVLGIGMALSQRETLTGMIEGAKRLYRRNL